MGSMTKNENPETLEINRKLSNLENTYCKQLHYYETAEKLPIWYLSTILVL